MKGGALLLTAFLVNAAVAGYLADRVTARWYAHEVAKPPLADSLAGVVARLTGGDSAKVARLRWWIDRRPSLGLGSPAGYAYRGAIFHAERQVGDIVAATSADGRMLTFATTAAGVPWTADPLTLKHELVHALAGVRDHPPALFARVESYSGR